MLPSPPPQPQEATFSWRQAGAEGGGQDIQVVPSKYRLWLNYLVVVGFMLRPSHTKSHTLTGTCRHKESHCHTLVLHLPPSGTHTYITQRHQHTKKLTTT